MTAKQEAFATAYARTGDAAYSAWKAGLGSPETHGSRMLRVPGVAEAIERKRTADCILLDASPEVAAIFVARLTGGEHAGRRYESPSHEQFAKLSAPYGKWIDSAVAGLEAASKAGEDVDSAVLIDRLREFIRDGEAKIQQFEASAAERARPVALIEAEHDDVFG